MRHLLSVSAAVLGLAGSVMAETWTVDDDGPADFDNIQAAVDAASDGDEIVVEPGVYTGTGASVINPDGKAIMIRAVDGPEDTFIGGNGVRQGVVFFNGETADTMLVGFTIIGCRTSNGAGIMCLSSSPTIINCVIKNNIATDSGGGIYCYNNSSPTFTDCTITDNTAGGQYGGGGIHCFSSSPTISDCTITNNTAAVGGGIACFWHDSDPTIIGCTIENNTASGTYGGGGIYCAIYTNPSLASTTLCGNDPDQIVGDWTDEGGNAVSDECYPSGACCIETSCSTETAADCSAAGGKYIGDGSTCSGDPCGSKNTTWTVDDDGPADFDNIQAAVDAAIDGDEIVVEAGTYTGTGDEVVDMLGKAITLRSSGTPEETILDGDGERLVVLCNSGEGADTVIEGFTIMGSDQHGILCRYNSSPTISGCTISNNTGYWEYGGGINCSGGSSPTITDCTISNNTSYGGGGIYCYSSSNLTLTNCEITGNTALGLYGGQGMGGGIWCISSNPTLTDTVVCGNDPDQIHAVNGWTDNGGNTVSDECPPDCPDVDGDGMVGVNDVLAVVAAWGSDDPDADVNGDGIVGTDDLLAVIGAWGPCE